MTGWLDEKQDRAWRTFIETVNDLTTAIERDLGKHGITLGDYQVLVFLSEADGRALRMVDLADRLQLSPSGLTRRLDGLVKGALVERQPSALDGRVMMAVLTDEGLCSLERIAPHHVASVRGHIFDRLDDDQVAAMTGIFESIQLGLRQKPAS